MLSTLGLRNGLEAFLCLLVYLQMSVTTNLTHIIARVSFNNFFFFYLWHKIMSSINQIGFMNEYRSGSVRGDFPLNTLDNSAFPLVCDHCRRHRTLSLPQGYENSRTTNRLFVSLVARLTWTRHRLNFVISVATSAVDKIR